MFFGLQCLICHSFSLHGIEFLCVTTHLNCIESNFVHICGRNAKTNSSNSTGRPPNLALALRHLRVDHSLCASIDDRASLAATFVNVGAFCAMVQLGPHWAAIKVRVSWWLVVMMGVNHVATNQ